MPKHSSRGLAARLRAEGNLAVSDHPVVAMTGDRHGTFIKVPVEAITTNPSQPRKHFDEGALEELADSIRRNGVLQPIIVKKLGEGFLLVAGERRFRAAKLAELMELPAILTTGDEQEIALIENVQREDLTALEEAEALEALRADKGYSHDELATIVGKSRVTVTELLSLTKLPQTIKDECRAPDIATKTHLLQILRESKLEKQIALWQSIKTGQMSTKAIRRSKTTTTQRGRPKKASRTFVLEGLGGVVTVQFSRARATKEDFHSALLAAARDVKREMKQG